MIPRPGRGGSLRRAAAVACIGGTLLTSAGCASSQHAAAPAAPTTSAAADPSPVALAYVRALYSGKFSSAAQYLAPSSQQIFAVITDGLRQSKVTARDLAVGSAKVTGDQAVVVLTGTFCQGGTTDCVTNKATDAADTDPVFQVQLTRSTGQWQVAFRLPTQSAGAGAGGLASAPATPSPSG